MHKISGLVLGFLVVLLLVPLQIRAEEEWTVIPAGGKPAYMGIHGGTMPVSLLASNDGSSLFTFVGRTGNDFIEVLRKAYAPLPSLGNSTRIQPWPHASAELFAGNATTAMRVLPLPNLDPLTSSLQPFGLSDEPLRIEGPVAKPSLSRGTKTFRLFSWPEYLRPRKEGGR